MKLLHEKTSGNSNVSHMIFQIFPTNFNAKRLLSECHFEPVSRWTLDILLKEYEAYRANEIADFYFNVSAMRGAASLRGHMFKGQVLNHFSDMSIEHSFPIRGLIRSNRTTWIYRGPIRRITFRESTIIDSIKDTVRNRQPLHLVPFVPNFPAVDSILYDPNDPDAVLTCIQNTINVDHDIVVLGSSGYPKLAQSLYTT